MDGHVGAVVEAEFVAELHGGDEFELVVAVVGPFRGDDVCLLGVFAGVVLDAGGVAVGRPVGALVVLPAVDDDGFERREAAALADAVLGEVDVQRPEERLVAELLDELLHVSRQGDVVASLAHAAGDRTVQVDAGLALEDAPVVGVLALECVFARLGDGDPLPVADDFAVQQVGLVQALEAPRGRLRRRAQPVRERRTGHLLFAVEATLQR
jgi:hypothetical protein